jgi:hypothetical protein
MKTHIRSLALVVGCCLGWLGLPQSGCSQGFYFDAHAGASIAEDVKINHFLVPTPGAKLKLDVGPQVRVAGGYHFNDYVGVQLESGFIYNQAQNLPDSSLSHIPMLFDVVLRYDQPDCRWVPYAGAGAGADLSILTLDHVSAPTGAVIDGQESSIVFAWQAFAGLRFKFTPTMSIGAGYKYYSADGGNWDVTHPGGRIDFGTARVHSVGLDFTLKF